MVEKGKIVSDTYTTSKTQSSSEAMEIDKKEELTVATDISNSERKGSPSSGNNGKKRKGIEDEQDKQGGWTVVKGSSFPRVLHDSDYRRDCIRSIALSN